MTRVSSERRGVTQSVLADGDGCTQIQCRSRKLLMRVHVSLQAGLNRKEEIDYSRLVGLLLRNVQL